jgi:hypothetical protein
MRAWDFGLAGGGLFILMDLSFGPKDPRGTRVARNPIFPQGPVQRRQLRELVAFMNGLDFVQLRPAPETLVQPLPAGLRARVLASPGNLYALYVRTEPGPRKMSVRWSGSIVPRRSGEYTLQTRGRGGTRLWVDGRLLIDHWKGRAPLANAVTVQLEAEKPVGFRLEHFVASGGGKQLFWQSAGQSIELVPASQLRTPEGEAGGVRGEYFVGTNLEGEPRVRKDRAIDWKITDSPFTPGPFDATVTASLAIPAGKYRVEWVEPATGVIVTGHQVDHPGGVLSLETPRFADDIAARIRRR